MVSCLLIEKPLITSSIYLDFTIASIIKIVVRVMAHALVVYDPAAQPFSRGTLVRTLIKMT